ncbi:MAG: DNA polymerase/3'-5' exonuclease PolX [Candidatus Spechtbacterales bacterium]
MINKELAHIFEEMAIMYEIDDDKFRQRAYHRGAYTMDNLSEDVGVVYKKDGLPGLKELPGIGEGMAKKIEEYIKAGHIKEYEDLKKKIPVDLEKITAVEGIGAKAVKAFYTELGVRTLEDLEKAAKDGKIKELPGFGEKTEQNILQGISFVKDNGGRISIGKALPYARELVAEIDKLKGVKRVSEAGSLRRRQETIGDVDILVASDPSADSGQVSKEVFDHVENLPQVVKTWGRGETKLSVHLRQGFDIDIRVVPPESWGAALQYFTGSKEHNVKMRQIAISKKYKLNEYGLFHGKRNVLKTAEEKEVYSALGMEYIEPEMRLDTGEIEAALRQSSGQAQKNKLPKLIEYGSIKGDLQIQTKWTDGAHSIEEMAEEAKRMGLEYIAITDHTKALAMTGGLNEKKLLEQKTEIEKINKKIKGITILSGSECDILKDGSLDIEDDVLAQLDVVGISVHSHFNLPRKEQTERVIKAMRNTNADIFFHPTGRRINKRAPIDIDMEKVIEVAIETGTILEINAHPERLDLKDDHIRMAVEAGAKLCINSDAHSKEGISILEYGVAQARRGWATAGDVINTLSVEEFLKALK